MIGYLSALILLVLPGAWAAFGFPLQPISFAARLAIAGALSPAIVPLQFYAVRLLGAPFEVAVWVLVVLNLGSAALIARRWKDLHFSPKELAAFASVFLFLAACILILVPLATSTAFRLYNSHQWVHAGFVYQFSEGRLIPEEPELAGVRLRYPLLGHVYWAVLSKVLNMPPTQTYVVTNVVTLLWICMLVYETCRMRGARPFAGLVALIWMALGTGAVGYFFMKIMGGNLHGDIRYSPWLRKFLVFELLPFPLAMFAAIMLLGVLAMRKPTGSRLALIAILLSGIGLVYPVTFPAAVGFCGVLLLLLAKQAWVGAHRQERGRVVAFLAELVVVGLISLAYAYWLTEGRKVSVATLSRPLGMLRKTFEAILALSPLLLGVALVAWHRLKEKENLLLLGGAIPGFFCNVMLHVSAGSNEYKYVFSLAVCLAPVACLALDRWPVRMPAGVAVVASAALFCSAIFSKGPLEAPETSFPKLEEQSFQLLLSPGDPDRNWTDAVRDLTPHGTVLAVRRAKLYWPALTGRSLVGPPEQPRSGVPGYWQRSRFNLVDERGYPSELVDDREKLLQRIFVCQHNCQPEAIDEDLRRLGRPVAFMFHPGEDSEFRSWLAEHQRGSSIYSAAGGPSVWLYKP